MITASPTTPDWLRAAARIWADLLGVEHWTIAIVCDDHYSSDYATYDPVTLTASIHLSLGMSRGTMIACLVQGLLRIALVSLDQIVLATVERVPKLEYEYASQVYQGTRDLALAQLAVSLVSSLQHTVDLLATIRDEPVESSPRPYDLETPA